MRRVGEAWDLRVQGATWAEVAKQCGFSNAANAHRAVTRWREGLPQVDLVAQREVAAARGEALWSEAWRNVEAGKSGAIRDAVSVLARQAQLLGLDAPKVSEVTHHEGVSLEVLFDHAGSPQLPGRDVIEIGRG